MSPAARPRFVLYDRDGCHLCAEARAQLERLAPVLDFDVTVRDVDADPALAARYGERVPVVAFGAEESAEEIIAAPFEPPALRVAIARAISR